MVGSRTPVAETAAERELGIDIGYELTVVDLDPLRAAICAVGELDIAAREDLNAVLRRQQDARRRYVRVDLSEVTFLDCSCLEVLVAAHRRFLEMHGMLVLSGVEQGVSRILEITGLDDTLFIVAAEEDPFGSVLMARAARRGRIPQQRRAPGESFDDLLTIADQPKVRARRSKSVS